MAVITMTREMGSLGKDVAAGLAESMGLEVIHHELVEHDVAERMSLAESDVHRFLEGTPSMLERWKIGKGKLFRYTAEEIIALAEKDDVVIRGWGATFLLQRVPHVVRVRVCAPMSCRVRTLQDRLGLEEPRSARREIERNDAAHSRTVRAMGDLDWTDPLHYDLVLNTERLPIEECVAQVRRLADSPAFAKSESSERILSDLATEARARNVVSDDRQFASAGNLNIEVRNGVAKVSGIVQARGQGASLCRSLESVPGVRGVENRLIVPASYPS